MKRTIAVLLIMMLCACVTLPSGNNTPDRRTDSKWVGRSVDELLTENGEPSNIYTLEGGGRVLEYLKLNMAKIGTQTSSPAAVSRKNIRPDEQIILPGGELGGPQLRPVEKKTSGQAVIPDGYIVLSDGQAASRREMRQKNSAQYCTIRFNVSASDIVESWSIEGKNCK